MTNLYTIDPTPPHAARDALDAMIVLVGCGGTGGFLAEALCRLLLGRRAALYLVDLDRVEPHNVARQAFDPADVGRFKAQVLAERLARRFRREVGYAVVPYCADVHAAVFRAPSRLNLVVGAVDNAAARRAIADTLKRDGPRGVRPWWLDCGNARDDGQVLLGSALRREELRGAFVEADGRCRALPAPSLQRPDLLTAPPRPQPAPAPDCAEAVAAGEQGATINQVVAAVAASFVEKLLDGTCAWADAYFNLADGTLRCRPPDPRLVASLTGLHVNALVDRRRPAEVAG